MIPVYYNSSYVGAAHSFDTTRKAGWIARSLDDDPIDGIEIHSPNSLSAEQVSIVHDPAYVRAVETGEPRSLAESQGFPWDPGIWTMVVASTGGGTHSLIKVNPRIWQGDVSVDGFDRYTPSERTPLNLVRSADDYLPAIDRELSTLERTAPRFDLCIYNAGMDPYEGCDIGGLSGITLTILARREMIVFEWCLRRKIPVAFVLAGGYVGDRLSQEELVLLHRFTIEAAS